MAPVAIFCGCGRNYWCSCNNWMDIQYYDPQADIA